MSVKHVLALEKCVTVVVVTGDCIVVGLNATIIMPDTVQKTIEVLCLQQQQERVHNQYPEKFK